MAQSTIGFYERESSKRPHIKFTWYREDHSIQCSQGNAQLQDLILIVARTHKDPTRLTTNGSITLETRFVYWCHGYEIGECLVTQST